MIQELIKLGFKRNAAICFSILFDGKEHLMRDIEMITGLRQPEVSVSLKQLNEMGYISTRDADDRTIGRPYKLVSLSYPPAVVVEIISADIRNEYTEKMELAQKLINMSSVNEEQDSGS